MPGSIGDNEHELQPDEQTGPSLRKHLQDIAVIAGFVGVTYTVLRYLRSRNDDRQGRQATTDRGDNTPPSAGGPIEVDIPEESSESGVESGAGAGDEETTADVPADDNSGDEPINTEDSRDSIDE